MLKRSVSYAYCWRFGSYPNRFDGCGNQVDGRVKQVDGRVNRVGGGVNRVGGGVNRVGVCPQIQSSRNRAACRQYLARRRPLA